MCVLGKDSDDEALMLEDSHGDIRWTSFELEEALVFTVEFTQPDSHSHFYLCTTHEGVLKYVCISPDGHLVLSANLSSVDMISFEVIELFEAVTSDIESEVVSPESTTASVNNTTPSAVHTTTTDTTTSHESPESGTVHYAGNLMKKGDDILGKWKQRYFVARNEVDHFRIDYYEKEGGSKKGFIDCTGMEAVKSTAQDEKFGLLLLPPMDKNSGAGNRDSGRSMGRKSSGGRIYRLKAPSAESQEEWLQVFTRACQGGDSKASLDNERGEESVSREQRSPSPALLTAERLSETSLQSPSRTRSRSNSAGSLTISIPGDTSVRRLSTSLFTCMFEDGALGMTLKRRTCGVIYIATVEANTQAAKHKLSPGDTLWSIGSKVVGNVAVDKEGWVDLVGYIKQTPRPIEMVFQKMPTTTEGSGQEEASPEDIAQEKEECSSTRSAYSLVDYPTVTPTASRDGVKPRAPSPSTPMSLQSMPSMTSSGSLQSMDTSTTGSSGGVIVSQPIQQKEDLETEIEKAELDEQVVEEDKDIERSIVESLSKVLIFKDSDSTAGPSGKKWRGSILGGSKAKGGKPVAKPSFQLVKDGRRLAFEGQLSLLSKRALWQVKVPKMLYLFNDLLIVAVPSTTSASSGGDNKYVVEQIIELMTCKINCNVSASHEMVDGNIEPSKRPLLWELLYPASTGTGSMVFLCPSLDIQQKWVQHLAHCICDHVSVVNGSSDLGIGWRHQYVLGTMHAAVLQRNQPQIINLLESFANGEVEEDDLEGADEDGYTPLHYASILRLTGIVRLLQESRCDVILSDNCSAIFQL